MGLVLAALTCPRQTTDDPIHGALYVPEKKFAFVAEVCV